MNSPASSPELPVLSVSLPRDRGLVLRNLADFQTELARVAAGFVPALSEWDLRCGLPLHLFADFRMVQDLRVRQRELGVIPTEIHLSGSAPVRALLDCLCEAPSSADALEAIYLQVKPQLLKWIDAFLQATRSVYDLPSAPLLEANRDLLRGQIAWASEARPRLGEPDALFQARVLMTLGDLESELAVLERRRSEPVRLARRIGRLPLADGVLPRGFSARATLPKAPTPERPYAERERFFAMNFMMEMQATDSCASILFEAPDMPWDFYFDAARHMWDESRHATFGELKLKSLGMPFHEVPLSTTAYRLRQTLTPHDRYAALTTQEADAFPGKHAGLKAALEHHDTVGAMTWSYDIADETQHVRFGQKWLPGLIKAAGDPRSPDQVRTDAENWRANVLAVTYRPDSLGTAPSPAA
jgi:hypothetical protein